MQVYPFPAQISKYELIISYYAMVKDSERRKIHFFIGWRVFSQAVLCLVQGSGALLAWFLEVLFMLLQLGEAARTACTAWEQTVGSGL